MRKLSINTVAAASEKRCCLLYLKEKKYSLEKKKKKERGEATSRPSDVLHHCSGTKLLLGLKKAKGNRRRAWLPTPPPDKVFKALKCSADSPALPRMGWVLFTFNAEEIHGAQGTRRNTTEYIRVLQKMHGEEGRCRCGACPSKEIFQVRLRHLVTLNPSFAPLQN